jgi:hypothetical protein
MPTRNVPDAPDRFVDIVVSDSSDRAVLYVIVKGGPAGPDRVDQLLDYLRSSQPEVPFGMLVDPEKIVVLRSDIEDPARPTCELKTADVLSLYEPEYRTKRIFFNYLQTLIEVWLRDLALHWKTESPPGSEELRRIGLVRRLEGDSVTFEAKFYGDPLY